MPRSAAYAGSGLGPRSIIHHHSHPPVAVGLHCREVRDKLVRACLARGVEIKYNASLEGLRPLDSSALDDTQPATTGKPTEDGTESQPSEVPAVQGEQGPPGSGQQGTTKQGQGKTGQPRTRRRNPGWVCKLADGSEHKTDRLVSGQGVVPFNAWQVSFIFKAEDWLAHNCKHPDVA
jgi:hypothetical protein